MSDIVLKSGVRGDRGYVEGGGMYGEGRTIAEALSVLVARMARDKDLLGVTWRLDEYGLRGTVVPPRKRRKKPKALTFLDG